MHLPLLATNVTVVMVLVSFTKSANSAKLQAIGPVISAMVIAKFAVLTAKAEAVLNVTDVQVAELLAKTIVLNATVKDTYHVRDVKALLSYRVQVAMLVV